MLINHQGMRGEKLKCTRSLSKACAPSAEGALQEVPWSAASAAGRSGGACKHSMHACMALCSPRPANQAPRLVIMCVVLPYPAAQTACGPVQARPSSIPPASSQITPLAQTCTRSASSMLLPAPPAAHKLPQHSPLPERRAQTQTFTRSASSMLLASSFSVSWPNKRVFCTCISSYAVEVVCAGTSGTGASRARGQVRVTLLCVHLATAQKLPGRAGTQRHHGPHSTRQLYAIITATIT